LVAIERLTDKPLRDFRPVRVRGVDDGDAEIDRRSQDGDRLVVVGRLAPNSRPRNPHRAKAEAVNREIATERKRSARSRRPRVGSRRDV
jgi:hypothetical protein